VTDRRPPGGPGEQFRDRLLGGLGERSDGDQRLVGSVLAVAIILLLVPRGQTGPALWFVVALVFGGALIEAARIARSGVPLRLAIVSAARLFAGPAVFVGGAVLITSLAPAILDERIPRPVVVAGLLALTLVAWVTIWRLLRIR
jgi:hypothetical protein